MQPQRPGLARDVRPDDGRWRRAAALLAVAVTATLLASPAADRGGEAPRWSFTPAAPSAAGHRSEPGEDGTGVADPAIDDLDGDEGLDPTAVTLSPGDGRIQVYAGQPSILPGEPLRLHTSTSASRYSITVTREGARPRVVFAKSGYRGVDYGGRLTSASATHTVRANWPTSISITTRGWRPGVYTVLARDNAGRSSGTVFAVRSPTISQGSALFVLALLDYQAYNAWGGHSFYIPRSARSFRASFDRPYDRNGGLSYWPVYDRHIVAWLEAQGYPLAYTTDYDLSMTPPDAAPRLLVLGQHAEYVSEAMFAWTERHVNAIGDMSVADFGANSYYWQVRMAPDPRGSDYPYDEVCYKLRRLDPLTQTDPAHATVRWSEYPVLRPIASVFGARYAGIVDGGYVRRDLVITSNAPPWALRGTGWAQGTVLHGLLLGEADEVVPEQGGIAIARGSFHYAGQGDRRGAITIRESPAGARVFDAGTFFYGAALAGTSIGVSHSSFDRFSANVLAWLWDRPGPHPAVAGTPTAR